MGRIWRGCRIAQRHERIGRSRITECERRRHAVEIVGADRHSIERGDRVVGVDQSVYPRQAGATLNILEQAFDGAAVAGLLDAEGAIGLPPGFQLRDIGEIDTGKIASDLRRRLLDEGIEHRRPPGRYDERIGNDQNDTKGRKVAGDFRDIEADGIGHSVMSVSKPAPSKCAAALCSTASTRADGGPFQQASTMSWTWSMPAGRGLHRRASRRSSRAPQRTSKARVSTRS